MVDTSLLRAAVLTIGGATALGWASVGVVGAMVALIAATLLIFILARERPKYGPHQ